ncbi:MAG: hypothetical protein ACOYJB_08800 [Christensenellaceae bacterium]|jgi:predicted RNase H-like nuclease (RuvC/YqgF family)
MDNIREIKEKLTGLEALESQVRSLQKKLQEMETQEKELRIRYEKACKAQKKVAWGLFKKKFEKKRREFEEIQKAYECTTASCSEIKNELEQIRLEWDALGQLEKEYKTELKRRTDMLLSSPESVSGRRYGELLAKKKQATIKLANAEYALRKAQNVKSAVRKAANSLHSAGGWADYDVARGAFL